MRNIHLARMGDSFRGRLVVTPDFGHEVLKQVVIATWVVDLQDVQRDGLGGDLDLAPEALGTDGCSDLGLRTLITTWWRCLGP